MAEQYVGKIAEFKDGDRRIVFAGDNEIGVFRHEGQFYAYSNFCLHQGGPACEGLTIAKVEERLRPDKTSQGLYFSENEMHFVCPWHGMEYDMKTGECVSDRKMKLRNFRSWKRETRSMSSPKAAKVAWRCTPASYMNAASEAPIAASSQAPRKSCEARTLAADIERACRRPPRCSDTGSFAGLMAAVCKLYAAQVEAGEQFCRCSHHGGSRPPTR